jgi:hypothetical protein
MSNKSQRRRNAKRSNRRRDRTPILVVGGILVLVVAGLLFAISQSTAGQSTVSLPAVPVTVSGSPRLQVDRDLIDFGQVPVGKMVKASFVLGNSGDQALTISHPPVPRVLEGC